LEILARGRPGDVRRDDAPVAVDEEGFRDPGHAPAPERVADAVADGRVVDAVPAQVRAGCALRVEGVDSDEHDTFLLPGPGGGCDAARLLLTWDAVGLPEVDDDDLAAKRREAETAARVEARQIELRRRNDLALVDLLRDAGAGAVGHVPDEQPEEPEHRCDDDDADDLHQTMCTVVPISTRSKSHSASGTCIRMQPCETL